MFLFLFTISMFNNIRMDSLLELADVALSHGSTKRVRSVFLDDTLSRKLLR